jgi:hypothetical protein
LDSLTKASTLSNDTLFVIAELGTQTRCPATKPAQSSPASLEDAEAGRYVDSYLKAIIYSGLGDREKTVAELRKGFPESLVVVNMGKSRTEIRQLA